MTPYHYESQNFKMGRNLLKLLDFYPSDFNGNFWLYSTWCYFLPFFLYVVFFFFHFQFFFYQWPKNFLRPLKNKKYPANPSKTVQLSILIETFFSFGDHFFSYFCHNRGIVVVQFGSKVLHKMMIKGCFFCPYSASFELCPLGGYSPHFLLFAVGLENSGKIRGLGLFFIGQTLDCHWNQSGPIPMTVQSLSSTATGKVLAAFLPENVIVPLLLLPSSDIQWPFFEHKKVKEILKMSYLLLEKCKRSTGKVELFDK